MAKNTDCQKDSDKEALEWVEESRKTLLTTRIGTVCSSHCRAEDGTEGDYIILDAPDWAIVIPELEGGKRFLVVDQWRHGPQKMSREFPGGVIEKDETPAEGATRELREETGCTADELIHLGSTYPNPALQSNQVHFFLARGLHKNGEKQLDDDEFLECTAVSAEEIFKGMGKPPYTHALACAAFSSYRQFLDETDGNTNC